MSKEAEDLLIEVAGLVRKCLYNGNKILICGNGGSAADSQHFAAELVGRYKKERKSLPAVALTTDTSILTAIGNDYGYENVFSRQVEGLGRVGDIFIGISTSGNSPNVVKAAKLAKKMGIITVALTGEKDSKLKKISDYTFSSASADTPHIQASHIIFLHLICELVEKDL